MGAEAGAWIDPGLEGQFGAVTLQIPKGFEAYARIFHPASDQRGKSVRWSEAAEACGTTPHQEMQWHAILALRYSGELRGSYRPGDGSGVKWAGSDPPVGAMPIDVLDALCEILAGHTVAANHCFFGLCTICGWTDSFSSEKLPPLLELPYGRCHIVLTGPLSAVDQIAHDWPEASSTLFVAWKNKGTSIKRQPPNFLRRESPNLIWPADHSSLVASEVDFDSTLVAGTSLLIDSIVESPKLEAWRVEPADSLVSDADRLNGARAI